MSKLPDTSPKVDLTATQYVILAENQRKKKALADTKEAYSKLLADNTALVQQLHAAQKDNYQVTEHFRREVLAKNDRIAALQTQLDQVRAQHEADMQQQRQAAAEREAEQRQQAQEQLSALVAQVSELQLELAAVLEFKQQRADHTAALAALREENQGLRETLSAQKSQLERYYAGLNAKMRKEYEQKLEELKRSGEEDLQERLGASVKRILGQNRRLAEELQLHVQESDVLVSEVKVLESERGRLSRELEMKQALEEGWAKRGAVQAAALKESQTRITGLEANLQQVLTDFAAERSALVAAAAARVQDAEGERDAMRRLLQLKTRELKQVRRLGQEVLLQRSAVETFLLAALQQVQQERGPQEPFIPPPLPAGTHRPLLQAPASPRSAAVLSPRAFSAGAASGSATAAAGSITAAAAAAAAAIGSKAAPAQPSAATGTAKSKVPTLPSVIGVSAAALAAANAAQPSQQQPSSSSTGVSGKSPGATAASSSGHSSAPATSTSASPRGIQQLLQLHGSSVNVGGSSSSSNGGNSSSSGPPPTVPKLHMASSSGAAGPTQSSLSRSQQQLGSRDAASSSSMQHRPPPTSTSAAAEAGTSGPPSGTGDSMGRGTGTGSRAAGAVGAGQAENSAIQGIEQEVMAWGWEEREQVLRLLLAKISNSAKTQQAAQVQQHMTGVPAGSSGAG